MYFTTFHILKLAWFHLHDRHQVMIVHMYVCSVLKCAPAPFSYMYSLFWFGIIFVGIGEWWFITMDVGLKVYIHVLMCLMNYMYVHTCMYTQMTMYIIIGRMQVWWCVHLFNGRVTLKNTCKVQTACIMFLKETKPFMMYVRVQNEKFVLVTTDLKF